MICHGFLQSNTAAQESWFQVLKQQLIVSYAYFYSLYMQPGIIDMRIS